MISEVIPNPLRWGKNKLKDINRVRRGKLTEKGKIGKNAFCKTVETEWIYLFAGDRWVLVSDW